MPHPSSHPNHSQQLRLLALAAVATGACHAHPVEFEEGDAGVAVAAQGLMGGVDHASCDVPTRRSVLNQAAILGRTLVQSNAYQQCLTIAIRSGISVGMPDGSLSRRGPYRECTSEDGDSLDPFPFASEDVKIQRALQTASSPNIIESLCDESREDGGGGGRNLTSASFFLDGNEEMTIFANYLDDAHQRMTQPGSIHARVSRSGSSVAQLSNTIWHEAFHAHEWTHQNCDPDDADCHHPGCVDGDHTKTMPWIAGDCMYSVGRQAMRTCDQSMCATHGGRIAVPSNYGGSSCVCIRDATEDADIGSEMEGATPVLGDNQLNDRYGFSTVKADFNRDGFEDVAVGAPGEGGNAGRVYIYHGTAFGLYPEGVLGGADDGVFTDIYLDAVPPPGPGDFFGYSLAAGDFNDDGHEDLAVGLPGRYGYEGRVWVYRGSDLGLIVGDAAAGYEYGQEINSPNRPRKFGKDEAGDLFGFALAAGDLDGDLGDDLVVGAPGEKPGKGPAGAGWAFVLESSGFPFAAPSLEVSNQISPRGNGDVPDKLYEKGRFGAAIEIGLLGADGRPDIVIGAPGASLTGRAYIYEGSDMPRYGKRWIADYTIAPSAAGFAAQFGKTLAIGRFGPNAMGTVAVGAPNGTGSGGQANVGGVIVYSGIGAELQRFGFNDVAGQMMGNALHGGNLDAPEPSTVYDRDELIITTGSSVSTGFLFVMSHQGSTLTGAQALTQSTMGVDEVGDLFGASVVVADINGDTLPDLVAGAPGEAPGSDPNNAGAIFTYRRTEFPLVGGNAADFPLMPFAAFNQED